MQDVHNAYQQQQQQALTRIELLIELYDVTIRTFENGIEALKLNLNEQFGNDQRLAMRCILEILNGIDTDYGEVAENVQRICVYVFGLVEEGSVAAWQDAIKILKPLQESFQAIRDEAMELEAQGAIPSPLESNNRKAAFL